MIHRRTKAVPRNSFEEFALQKRHDSNPGTTADGPVHEGMRAVLHATSDDHAPGASGPLIVYVPGIDGTGELLLGTAESLAESFRVARLRYEGRGPSDARLYERLAASVAARLDDLGAESAIVLAESFGGGVALQLALDRPDRVSALALVNTFAWYPARLRARLSDLVFPFTPTWVLRAGRRFAPAAMFFRPRRDPDAEALFDRAKPGFEDAGYADRLSALRQLDLRGRLGEIACPVALFAATHDRVVPSLETMKTLEEGLPDATLETIDRAGHVVLPLRDEPWASRLNDLAHRASSS